MSLTFSKTSIEGLLIVDKKGFGDSRGSFTVDFNYEQFLAQGVDFSVRQIQHSSSKYATIRGLHYQRAQFAQAKYVWVSSGSVFDVAVDLRPGSSTFGQHIGVILTEDNSKALYIPRGFAHGFAVLSLDGATFSYICDNSYSPANEGGLIYNDATLGIDWQLDLDTIEVSEKDKAWPTLSELKINNPFE